MDKTPTAVKHDPRRLLRLHLDLKEFPMLRHLHAFDFFAPRILAASGIAFAAILTFVIAFLASASLDFLLDAHPAWALVLLAGIVVAGAAGSCAILWIWLDLDSLAASRARSAARDRELSRRWISGGMPE